MGEVFWCFSREPRSLPDQLEQKRVDPSISVCQCLRESNSLTGMSPVGNAKSINSSQSNLRDKHLAKNLDKQNLLRQK